MREKKISFDSFPLPFSIEEKTWNLVIPKSETRVKEISQFDLLKAKSTFFAPIEITEAEDTYTFSFPIGDHLKKWSDIKKLERNEKLRILCNIAQLKDVFHTRITFFLHPTNIVFNENLFPVVVYRGIRNLLPPFEMNEAEFLKQYQCFAIALFSKKYRFEDLYNGSLADANDTEFDRKVKGFTNLQDLIDFLKKSYQKEQEISEKTMQLVPKKRFRLFKRLAITMIIVSILLAIPLCYLIFVKDPYQENLLTAHREFLATDYDNVISTLQNEKPEKLPFPAKYILATAYIKVDDLSDTEKEIILKNISLKSDNNYLLYWIYNGRGDFDESIDLAKYMDDPQLIMYGLIKKIEQVKNDPQLTGGERDELVNQLKGELKEYQEEYDLIQTEDEDEEEQEAVQSIDEPLEEKEDKEQKKDDPIEEDTNDDKEQKQDKKTINRKSNNE